MNNFCLIFCIVPFCTTLAPQTYPENIVSIKDREEATKNLKHNPGNQQLTPTLKTL